MKFMISSASGIWEDGRRQPHDQAVFEGKKDGETTWSIEVDTLEELLQVYRDVGHELILGEEDGELYIFIYDTSIE